MNLSGTSYLQSLLVNGFVVLCIFLRIHETRSWNSFINPLGNNLLKFVGLYSVLVSCALLIAKDGIMTGEEFKEVQLCLTSLLSQQQVAPPNGSEQISDIKRSLVAWDMAVGFQLLALGCALGSCWQQKKSITMAMTGVGGLGLVAAIAGHFGPNAYNTLLEMARSRSISRLVTSVYSLICMALLVWLVVRCKQMSKHCQQSVTSLHWIWSTKQAGTRLAILLFIKSVFFMAFDISYLTPQKTVASDIHTSNTLLGIATLATSLISLTLIHLLFPTQPPYLPVDQDEVKPGKRLTVTRDHRGLSEAEQPMVTKGTNLRRLTSASLRSNNHPINAAQMVDDEEKQPNYLQDIPYMDKQPRENSFFSSGPWAQPVVTRSISPLQQQQQQQQQQHMSKGPTPQPLTLEDTEQQHRGRSAVNSAFIPLSSASIKLKGEDSERASTFIPEDYEYQPMVSPAQPAIPMPMPMPHSVYVATPPIVNTPPEYHNNSSSTGSEPLQEGHGPILIHMGSKASIRRKNTVERRGRKQQQQQQETDDDGGALASVIGDYEEEREEEISQTTKLGKQSRMSAFATPPASLPSDASNVEQNRDSSTISSMSWENNRSRDASQQSQQSPRPQQLQLHTPPLPANAAAALKASYASIGSTGSSPNNDTFSSFSSLQTAATSDAFYTPESSVAQIAHSKREEEEERPNTAPTAKTANSSEQGSNSQRHTMGATSPSPDNVVLVSDGGLEKSDSLRRTQTVRKAVATDAVAIESSINNDKRSSGDGTEDLISALPLPSAS